jgi:DNA-binding LacI/PurR family transcriptional regulator
MINGRRRTAAARRAALYLDAAIQAALKSGRGRLPTVAAMSVAAAVSKGTMHRAVRSRSATGALRATHGSGIAALGRLQPMAPVDDGARAAIRKHDWLRQTIERDVANGHYAPGSVLPRVKQLCSTYGVGFRTLKAALAGVAASGAVTPWVRGYRVPALVAASRAHTILVVARGTRDYVQLITERTVECLATLEHECAARGLAVRVTPVYYTGTGLAYGEGLQRLIAEGPHRQGILGTVLFSSALGLGVSRLLTSTLSRMDAPLAVIDEADAADVGDAALGRRTRVFALAYGAGCGLLVGRLLAQLGHRRVAYVTTSPDSDWSRERCEGVRRGVDPDRGSAVVTMVGLRMADPPTVAAETADPLFASVQGTLGTMHRRRPLLRGLLWPEQQISRLVLSYRPWKQTSARLGALLDDRGVSAWVADNDVTALMCLSYLESRRVPVPQRIGVVGFDDGNFALVNNLTSYNFNCRAVMLAALNHLLAPSAAGPRRVEIEGYVAQRRTTGPTPGGAEIRSGRRSRSGNDIPGGDIAHEAG